MRAQAAMELIVNYGWSLLIIFAVIGGLAYFGVLDVQNVIPDRCVLGTGFHCYDVAVNEESISMMVRNGYNKDLTITAAQFKLQNDECSYVGDPIVLPANAEVNISTNERCLMLTKHGKTKIYPVIEYEFPDSTYPKKAAGEIVTR